MPLRSTGVESFRQRYPAYDGRGVLIAVLDGGIDPSVPGLQTTTTGERKLLDLRDFSGEGRIALKVLPWEGQDTVEISGQRLSGFGRIARLAAPPLYAGVLEEQGLGSSGAADVNGDGDREDRFPLVVGRASDGWFLMADTDGDGSLADESAVYDYARAGQWMSFGTGPMGLAANFSASQGRPELELFFDSASHGTHVAGIAAGHDLFGVPGFDGVAPGAQVLGLKIADNRWGKISVSGSMVQALAYAAAYAERRGMPLVVNLSYGVGNQREGTAVMDSVLDAFALSHPEVLVVVSAGNDGPGISTLGSPASAELALAVCALLPGVFARAPEPGVPPAPDLMGWWSARGGEVAKPDLCAPGVAYSNVPPWRTGEEIAGGTSQAAPHIAGLAALLHSGLLQQGRRARAIDIKQALLATAVPLPGNTTLDQGAGVPRALEAFHWLGAGHQAGIYRIRALPDGGNRSAGPAAYRRAGLAGPADTLQRFVIETAGGQPAARLLLRSDAPWLRAPASVDFRGEPAVVALSYDRTVLGAAGLYTGNVWARPATDTLAGWVLRLTNTIIVPQELDQPFSRSETLAAGQVERYFLNVPEGAGGLRVALDLLSGRGATLYLFEPSGQPSRTGSGLQAAGPQEPTVLEVPAEDLIPGVYEAVVSAPANSEVRYRFTAALAPVAIRSIGTGPSAVLAVTGPDSVRVQLQARVVGAMRSYEVRATGPIETIHTPVPSWAKQAVIEVAVPAELWRQVTDVGIRVQDGAGRDLSDRPMDYAFDRRRIELDSLSRAGSLSIGIRPAFALGPGEPGWTATVRIAYLYGEPLPLAVLEHGHVADLVLAPHQEVGLQLSALPEGLALPQGYGALVEVEARPGSGAPARRRAPVRPPREP